ncbi:3-dehydro-L-gulonate 2-dehydrogenase [Flavisolibacter nicotianae]|uniref:3-dehydro-L-gulonate 2-dehydrogenase n=1 Tax=Flavisolibacter nicotianae TaxID=2364882 RepID=UPI000EADABD7|nr:3-dehydro-L-gulonate 2-dehydrogenase [Flavisolibacter nicotianae]
MPDTLTIPFHEMIDVFRSILLQNGFSDERANTCAEVFATNSLEGVYSHGVNRFALFVQMVREGHVVPDATPVLRHATPSLEQWDGALGPGVLNATIATNRAVQLAKQNGLGCVALANTNHWMRGGYYGWQAAKAGCVFIGWSNTIANMPAYGASDVRLGNNPLVIAVPFQQEAIVLDMALSQFSYGAMQMAEMRGESLPVFGGYDENGKLTKDPAAIIKSGRTLSIGYWKGAGLSLLLDIVVAVLSGGLAVHQISQQKAEKGLSQVFVAIALERLQNYPGIGACIQNIISDYKQSAATGEVLYPGERVMRKREQNRQAGIPVVQKVWDEILSLQTITKSVIDQ